MPGLPLCQDASESTVHSETSDSDKSSSTSEEEAHPSPADSSFCTLNPFCNVYSKIAEGCQHLLEKSFRRCFCRISGMRSKGALAFEPRSNPSIVEPVPTVIGKQPTCSITDDGSAPVDMLTNVRVEMSAILQREASDKFTSQPSIAGKITSEIEHIRKSNPPTTSNLRLVRHLFFALILKSVIELCLLSASLIADHLWSPCRTKLDVCRHLRETDCSGGHVKIQHAFEHRFGLQQGCFLLCPCGASQTILSLPVVGIVRRQYLQYLPRACAAV